MYACRAGRVVLMAEHKHWSCRVWKIEFPYISDVGSTHSVACINWHQLCMVDIVKNHTNILIGPSGYGHGNSVHT